MANQTIANVGKIINSRWRITSPLSSDSGQGDTYKVHDLQNSNDKTEYVVKLLNKITDKSLARFKKEIEASLALKHQNIINVIDAQYEEATEPYLVMEFCSGGELDAKKIKNLSLIQKLKMFESICEAIAYARSHEKVVIHRDIKPRNIFLTDQKSKIPVIGDFGICFFMENGNEDERITALKGEAVGAKNFRPPEAELGILENVNPAFDVYSLGKMLYWFLSDGDLLVREYYNHPSFDLRIENCEQAIYLAYEIFDKSIRESPEDRYKNAVEMFDDVKKLVNLVENNMRYLDCNVPQNCIFCRNGKYSFESAPKMSQGDLDYSVSLHYGFDFHDSNRISFDQKKIAEYAPRVLIAKCDFCGNIQLFQTGEIGKESENWKNIPNS